MLRTLMGYRPWAMGHGPCHCYEPFKGVSETWDSEFWRKEKAWQLKNQPVVVWARIPLPRHVTTVDAIGRGNADYCRWMVSAGLLFRGCRIGR